MTLGLALCTAPDEVPHTAIAVWIDAEALEQAVDLWSRLLEGASNSAHVSIEAGEQIDYAVSQLDVSVRRWTELGLHGRGDPHDLGQMLDAQRLIASEGETGYKTLFQLTDVHGPVVDEHGAAPHRA